MATCNDCKNSVICCIRGRVPADFCASFNPKQQITTNADRIRAMSDEELADFITDKEKGWCTEIGREMYYQHNLEWLQQPAEVE